MSQRLNLLDPEITQDPYPFYAHLRRESPAIQVEPNGLWAISRYEDVVNAFKNPQVFSSGGLRMATEPAWLKRHNPLSDSLVLLDPPMHGRLRGLVTRAFTTSLLNRVESYARDVSERLAIMLLEKRTVDFIPEFALGLPMQLLALLIGFDPANQTTYKRWGDDMNAAAAVSPDDTARHAQVRKSMDEMERYMKQVIAERRVKPRDDLVSELLQVQVDGERLAEDELVGFLSLLLVAGLETTMFVLTNCVRLLAERPELMEQLRTTTTLIPGYIEEVIRYEPPLHSTLRLVTADTDVSGVHLPAGSMALLLVGSALRDDKQFPDGGRFDPQRGVPASLAFGHGIHFCLGAALARMEIRVALDTLLSMVSKFELRIPRIQWRQSLTIRWPESLPMEVHPL
jgi:cytochrome P450